MRSTRPGRAGFSLVELLMVLFVIGLVVSFMIPALMAGHRAARRCQCINNLKQLSLALQNYDTQYRVLPPGTINPEGPVRSEPVGRHTSWFLQLLPYLEQNGVYQAFDHEASVYAPENRTARITTINTLLCPEEREPLRRVPGVTSYAGCHNDVEAPIHVDNNGVFFLNSHISNDDLLDGATFTVFVGEKRLDPSTTDLGWVSGTRATLRNAGTPINGTALVHNPSELVAGPGLAPELAVGGFGSYHGAGANFAFGDGSVRWLTETIAPRVYRALANRADGEMIGANEY